MGNNNSKKKNLKNIDEKKYNDNIIRNHQPEQNKENINIDSSFKYDKYPKYDENDLMRKLNIFLDEVII